MMYIHYIFDIINLHRLPELKYSCGAGLYVVVVIIRLPKPTPVSILGNVMILLRPPKPYISIIGSALWIQVYICYNRHSGSLSLILINGSSVLWL